MREVIQHLGVKRILDQDIYSIYLHGLARCVGGKEKGEERRGEERRVREGRRGRGSEGD